MYSTTCRKTVSELAGSMEDPVPQLGVSPSFARLVTSCGGGLNVFCSEFVRNDASWTRSIVGRSWRYCCLGLVFVDSHRLQFWAKAQWVATECWIEVGGATV